MSKYTGLQEIVNQHRKRMKYSNFDLMGKLEEEYNELVDARNTTEFKNELADVVIVCIALATNKNINILQAILDKMKAKEENRWN